jgi:actin-related protein
MTRAAESHFKSRAIERIRRKYPYNNIIMVGGMRPAQHMRARIHTRTHIYVRILDLA